MYVLVQKDLILCESFLSSQYISIELGNNNVKIFSLGYSLSTFIIWLVHILAEKFSCFFVIVYPVHGWVRKLIMAHIVSDFSMSYITCGLCLLALVCILMITFMTMTVSFILLLLFIIIRRDIIQIASYTVFVSV